ncbi:hypothetical protein JL722_2701 [Aureococcus anophagefferens]|nr:hypothetical protein JL722_2701 [Aureococcus anophagefferens]
MPMNVSFAASIAQRRSRPCSWTPRRARRGAALLTAEEASFEAVLFDFAYGLEPEDFENRVNSSDGLLGVDNEFLETHGAFAKRFYALMESTVKYWRDVHGFLERLGSGYFIAHSVDNVLEGVGGKQLLCEALYGTLLVLLDAKVPGVVRERLVIACYRLEGESTMEAVGGVADRMTELSEYFTGEKALARVARESDEVVRGPA